MQDANHEAMSTPSVAALWRQAVQLDLSCREQETTFLHSPTPSMTIAMWRQNVFG